jgi:hypothetical protein
MKLLFSTQYGSKLYGTNTPTSDIDVKHIILPSLDDMLIGERLQNKVKKTNDIKFMKNSAEDIDEEYIPVQILARDFLEGQTYSLEICNSVEYNHADQVLHDPLFVGFCRELRNRFLTANMSALIGYAVNQASLYSFKGERLNAVRAAERLFKEAISNSIQGARPLDYLPLFLLKASVIAEEFPKYFQITEYAVDNRGNTRPCIKLLEKVLPFTSTFETSLKVVQSHLNKYGSRADAASIDNVDWKATMHALRVVDEGIALLTKRNLEFPFSPDYVDFLLQIKNGQLPYNIVIDMINERLDVLKTLEAESTLPKKSPEMSLQMDAWLAEWMRTWYGIGNSL